MVVGTPQALGRQVGLDPTSATFSCDPSKLLQSPKPRFSFLGNRENISTYFLGLL